MKFSVLRFPGFGCEKENFTKISRQKWYETTENFTANFTLLGRRAELCMRASEKNLRHIPLLQLNRKLGAQRKF